MLNLVKSGFITPNKISIKIRNSLLLLVLLTLLLTRCKLNSGPNTRYQTDYRNLVERLFVSGSWQESIKLAKAELQNPGINDELKVFYLLALGQNYRFSEKYKLSEDYFVKVVHHEKAKTFPDLVGEAYYGLGDLHYLQWSYFKEEDALGQAKLYLDSAMIQAKKSANLALESKILYRSGSILQIQGEENTSLENFKRGLEISFSISDTAGIIRNDIHKAAELERLGMLDSALFHYNRAYEYSKAQNRNYSEAHALCNLGLYYFDRTDLALAEDYFNQAKFLSEELNHGIILCRSYYSLSELYAKLQKESLSKEYFEKGLAIAKIKGYKNYERAFIELGNKLIENKK